MVIMSLLSDTVTSYSLKILNSDITLPNIQGKAYKEFEQLFVN